MADSAKYKNKFMVWTGVSLPEFAETYPELWQAAMLAGLSWFRQTLGPGHFLETAYGKYMGLGDRVYQSRTPKYVDRKLRRMHCNLPLVWSGDLRHEFLKGAFLTRPSGKSTDTLQAHGSWPGVNAMRYVFQERGSNAPRKYEELIVMTPAEEKTLQQRIQKDFSDALEAMGGGGNPREQFAS
jgi:hypothetical protein